MTCWRLVFFFTSISMPLVLAHVIKLTVSHLQPFFFFVMPSLQYEKLKYCYNTVDAREVIYLVELITS